MDYKLQTGEDLFKWQIRVCKNKDLYGLSWDGIADILNEGLKQNFSQDRYRKWWYSFSQGMEYAATTGVRPNEVLDELESKKIELLEERKKLQTVRVEYNKIAREKSRRELLFEHVKESFVKLDVPDPVYDLNELIPDKSHVLSFGDIHFGKEFESLNNIYNEEIAMNRMNEILSDTVKYIRKENIPYLHIINGADNVEGMTLRTSQLQSLQSGFVDQVIKFSKFYAKWIKELSKYVKTEVHHITSSNHTELRPFMSGRGEYPAEDLERIIGMYIQDVLEENERTEINLYENGFVDFELLGYNICSLHGHQLKGNKNAIRDLSQLHRKFYDYCFLFHFHHGNNLTVGEGVDNNIQIIQSPSVMGSDPYSDSLMTGAKPGAVITTFTKGKGKTDTHEIVLN
jgi:hypothetical protein